MTTNAPPATVVAVIVVIVLVLGTSLIGLGMSHRWRSGGERLMGSNIGVQPSVGQGGASSTATPALPGPPWAGSGFQGPGFIPPTPWGPGAQAAAPGNSPEPTANTPVWPPQLPSQSGGPSPSNLTPRPQAEGQPNRAASVPRQQSAPPVGQPSGGAEAAPGPWGPWAGGWGAPPQGNPTAAPGPWPAGFAAPATGGWPFAPSSPGSASSAQGTKETASIALSQLREQASTLASAAEDLANASIAMREKNQEQVREILQRSARKLGKVSEAWQEAINEKTTEPVLGVGHSAPPSSKPETTAALLAPIPIPPSEPTTAEERQVLEETVRGRLKLLQEPFRALENTQADVAQVRTLLQACREALSQGWLHSAAANLNAAMQIMQELLTDKPTEAARQR